MRQGRLGLYTEIPKLSFNVHRGAHLGRKAYATQFPAYIVTIETNRKK